MDHVNFNREDIVVYDNQPGEKEIHSKSGFRISHFQRSVTYEALWEIKPRAFSYYSIAHQPGYIDRFHFSKVFKRIKGISPDHFRRQYPMVH